MTIAAQLYTLGACRGAVEWAGEYGDDATRAWAECQRGDRMLWLLGNFSGDSRSPARKKLALCTCACARLAPPIKNGEWEAARLRCLDITEQWARGVDGVTLDAVRQARWDAAWQARWNTYAAAAAAADAAYSVGAIADAAAAAAYYAATATADDDDAQCKVLAQAADIVRQHYPTPPLMETMP